MCGSSQSKVTRPSAEKGYGFGKVVPIGPNYHNPAKVEYANTDVGTCGKN